MAAFTLYPRNELNAVAVTEPFAVRFFETQFRHQVEAGDFALNSFEQLALDYAAGEVLELGCGLGNLALAAARRGCRVNALDGSPTAIARLQAAARAEGLPIEAVVADFEDWSGSRQYDTVIAIGLLMFFPRSRALALLDALCGSVVPGGRCIINVLVEGTTYLDMFESGHYHLFLPQELASAFAGWQMLASRHDDFDAPGGTRKEFLTSVAVRPENAS